MTRSARHRILLPLCFWGDPLAGMLSGPVDVIHSGLLELILRPDLDAPSLSSRWAVNSLPLFLSVIA